MGRRTGDFTDVQMLAKRLNQRGCNWTLILVDDWENDTLAAVSRLGGRGDDHYHDDRDAQQRNEPEVVAGDEPKVLKHHGQRLQALSLAAGVSILRRTGQTAKTPESLRIIRGPLPPSNEGTNFQD